MKANNSMTPGALIIFSGLPGSGKSTLAANLASQIFATYIRIDTIEQGLRDVCGISKIDGSGYLLAHRIAQENLRIGNLVIADSVNPWELTRSEWNNVAHTIGARFVNVEVVCSDQDEHRKRVETRSSSVPGLKMPTWHDVVQRDYHAWTSDRCVIDTAGKTAGNCLDELLATLKNVGLLGRRP